MLNWPCACCCAELLGWELMWLLGPLSSAPAAGGWCWCLAPGASKRGWTGCWERPLCWIWPSWLLRSLCTGSTLLRGLHQTPPEKVQHAFTLRQRSTSHVPLVKSATDIKVFPHGSGPSGDAIYLDIDDGSELAEVFVELGDVVEIPRDLPHLQLGVHVMISFGKASLILVVEASPKKQE